MNKTVITTVGTSLLTKFFEDKDKQQKKSYGYEGLKKLPFYMDNSVSSGNKNGYVKHCQKLFTDSFKYIESNPTDACAEISSILAIAKELKQDLKENEELHLTIHLLCTDTILSPLCAEVIAKYWIGKGDTVVFEKMIEGQTTIIENIQESDFSSNHIIKDLRVDSKGNYEKGFMNLIQELDKLKLTKNDILNITGGYKAIIPILTLYGQLREIPLKYLYNDSELDKQNDLVTVGNLPINFDWEIAQNVMQYLETDKEGLILTDDTTVIEFLTLNKFITLNKKPSGFSSLLRTYMDKASTSKTVLGRFVEYKYYEYFNEVDTYFHKPSKLNFEYFINTSTNVILNLSETITQYNLDIDVKYSDLKRKIKTIGENLRTFEEIDLGLSLELSTDTNIICEVKPIGELSQAVKQLGYGILAFYKSKGYYPSELLFATYIVKFQFEQVIDWENELRSKNIPNILKQNLPKNIPEIPFRIIASELNLTNSFKVRYEELFRNILDAKYLYNNPINSETLSKK